MSSPINNHHSNLLPATEALPPVALQTLITDLPYDCFQLIINSLNNPVETALSCRAVSKEWKGNIDRNIETLSRPFALDSSLNARESIVMIKREFQKLSYRFHYPRHFQQFLAQSKGDNQIKALIDENRRFDNIDLVAIFNRFPYSEKDKLQERIEELNGKREEKGKEKLNPAGIGKLIRKEFIHKSEATYLDLENFSNLTNIDALNEMKKLKRLNLSRSFNLRDIDGLTGMKNFKAITLNDSPKLKSIHGLIGMKRLKAVFHMDCPNLKNTAEIIAQLKATNPGIKICPSWQT